MSRGNYLVRDAISCAAHIHLVLCTLTASKDCSRLSNIRQRLLHAAPMQVTIDGIELYDAVHWTVHIVHSETVAIIRCNIWGDQLIPNSGGIVIDGSRRVYLGENIISTADNAITVKTSSGEALRALKQASLNCSGLRLFLFDA